MVVFNVSTSHNIFMFGNCSHFLTLICVNLLFRLVFLAICRNGINCTTRWQAFQHCRSVIKIWVLNTSRLMYMFSSRKVFFCITVFLLRTELFVQMKILCSEDIIQKSKCLKRNFWGPVPSSPVTLKCFCNVDFTFCTSVPHMRKLLLEQFV